MARTNLMNKSQTSFILSICGKRKCLLPFKKSIEVTKLQELKSPACFNLYYICTFVYLIIRLHCATYFEHFNSLLKHLSPTF